MLSRYLNRLAADLVPTGPILDPEDCLDTEPPPVRPERVCRGRVPSYDWRESTVCQAYPDHYCETCGVPFDVRGSDMRDWRCAKTCANGCHWSECSPRVGCSWPDHWDDVHMRVDRCSARLHDVFTGNDMARPNHAPWPNPCEVAG